MVSRSILIEMHRKMQIGELVGDLNLYFDKVNNMIFMVFKREEGQV